MEVCIDDFGASGDDDDGVPGIKIDTNIIVEVVMDCAVIFGGAGFIGSFFARFLLDQGSVDKVYIYDFEPLASKSSEFRKSLINAEARIEFILGDVRERITWIPSEHVTLVANFAAVHREPGHEDHEYYNTNLRGAENVTEWTFERGCKDLIFTSSISPYGPSEQVKDEKSLPVPVTAYGGSKLIAEKIHQIWQSASKEHHLVIVRPGVVFGPGEGGNVSRLIKAVLGRYFFYMGNQDTRKAGVYVKELCNAMWWVLQRQKRNGENFSLFNMSMNPGPSIKEYVGAVCDVAGVNRKVVGIPYRLLYLVSIFIECLAKPLGIKHPFSPVRIRKLVRSNNIIPTFLVESGYVYLYTLKTAFEDWKENCPEEWR